MLVDGLTVTVVIGRVAAKEPGVGDACKPEDGVSTISHCRCVLPFDGLVQFGWNFINFPPIIFSVLGSSSSGGANLDFFALDLDLPFDAALYLALFSLMVASLGACGQSFNL